MFTSGVQIKHPDILEEGISQIGNLQRKTSVRILGSSALDLAHVASGKFDGFWCKRLNIWDIAAGILLVREAGGICLNDKGKNFDTLDDDSLIASSSAISSELFKNL
jgi:myo-inositol-1(or 4)-monophosphatase